MVPMTPLDFILMIVFIAFVVSTGVAAMHVIYLWSGVSDPWCFLGFHSWTPWENFTTSEYGWYNVYNCKRRRCLICTRIQSKVL